MGGEILLAVDFFDTNYTVVSGSLEIRHWWVPMKYKQNISYETAKNVKKIGAAPQTPQSETPSWTHMS